MNRLRTLALGTGLAALLAASPALAASVSFTIVTTNDMDRFEEVDGRGGFARLAAVVNAARAEGPVLFLHAGDAISPSLLSGIDRGEHMIAFLNALQPDAFVPGNHEFDFGPEVADMRFGEAEFDIVSSNVTGPDGVGPAGTMPWKIIDIDGVAIGIYGLTTEDTVAISSPGTYMIAPAVEAGVAARAELDAAGADLVVGLVHIPIDADFALLAAGGGDILVSGHDHSLLTYWDGTRVLTESASQADYVILIHVTVETDDTTGAVTGWTPSFQIVDTATVTPDPTIQAMIDYYLSELDAELNVDIGTTSTVLDSRRAIVRGQEAAIGNLIADALRRALDADVAIVNGGGIRADRVYEAGTTLTRRDILAELPFGNRGALVEITGADLLAALENGFSQIEAGAGRFPQVSGLIVEVNRSAAPGSRVTSVTVGGTPLDVNALYRVATNDFMVGGGDGYTSLGAGRLLIDSAAAQLLASIVIDHVTDEETVAPAVEGRIVLR